VAAVSYNNTKPLIYGLQQGLMKNEIELITDYPSNIAELLVNNEIDLALVPVAIIPKLKTYQIITNYCIGCDGLVASVCLFSEVPIEDVKSIWLDYQSKSSVGLLKILLEEYWKVSPKLLEAKANYEQQINGETAGLIIGDRAFEQKDKYPFVYDLGEIWKQHTGLPFVFAAWVSNKNLDKEFISNFNNAVGVGLHHIDEIVTNANYALYDLKKYYTQNISYTLDEKKLQALKLYLKKLETIC
jgi:chorismate dehydratase